MNDSLGHIDERIGRVEERLVRIEESIAGDHELRLIQQHPDLVALIRSADETPSDVVAVVIEMAASRRRPPMSATEVIDALARAGVPNFAARLRAELSQR